MTFEPPTPPARDPLDAPVLDASDFPTGSWAGRETTATRRDDPSVPLWPDPEPDQPDPRDRSEPRDLAERDQPDRTTRSDARDQVDPRDWAERDQPDRLNRSGGRGRSGDVEDTGGYTLPPVTRQKPAAAPAPASARPGWGKATTAGQVPSWRSTVKSGRLVAVRPSPLGVGAAFAGALVLVVAVLLYGAVEVDVLWSVLAGVAGVGGFVLVLRGFPLFGALSLALSAFGWGLAMRAWLPGSASDVLGDLRFIGGNLAYVVPLAAAFLLAIALDSHRVSRAAIEEALSGRRWWGEPAPSHTAAESAPTWGGADSARGDVSRASGGAAGGGASRAAGDARIGRGAAGARPAPLRELEALPAARFFALCEGPCSHLVAVGRRVALVLPAAWADGDYSVDADGRILRDGTVDTGASADLDGLVAGMAGWHKQLKDTGATLRGFLVVSPAGPAERVLLDVASGQHLQIVHGHEFPEAAGGWLAAEPYRIDLAVTERLLAVFGDAPSAGVVPRSAPRQGQRRAGQGHRAASRSGKMEAFDVAVEPEPRDPSPAETAKELAPGWDSESARQLADWGAGPPPEATEWWKGP